MYQGGDAVSKTVCGGFNSQLSVPDVCYRSAAPRKGKTATRGLPVRCMKAAGRIIYLAGSGL